MNTSEIGNIGESRILYEFTKRGIKCFLPYGDGNEVDMIAYFNNRLNRIQIKTSENLKDGSLIIWKLTRQDGWHGNSQKYQEDSIDYFALYCIETDDLCLVPFSQDLPQALSVRIDSYDGVRKSGMRFVSDYSMDKIISST